MNMPDNGYFQMKEDGYRNKFQLDIHNQVQDNKIFVQIIRLSQEFF